LEDDVTENESEQAWTEQEINEYKETTYAQEKIINTVNTNIETPVQDLRKGDEAMHCWRWANKMYEKAGYDIWKREVIYQNWDYYKWIWEQLDNDALMLSLKIGDWIYVHNWNWIDKLWDHSAIFMWRKNKERWIAKITSYSGSGNYAHKTKINLNKNAIRHISRPISA
jgi:hypothetical protein